MKVSAIYLLSEKKNDHLCSNKIKFNSSGAKGFMASALRISYQFLKMMGPKMHDF